MICLIDPVTGLGGDMLLAALLDVGAPAARVRAAISSTGLTGWRLTAERITDHGLSATLVRVEVADTRTGRRPAELVALASRATPEPVASLAVAAVSAIAEAEGRLHATDPDEASLHELGGHRTIVSIVGVAAALHALGVVDVVSAPLPLGLGHVTPAHGVFPRPAPATFALLTGAVVTGTDVPGETVTPTGAALLRAVGARYDVPPLMTAIATGYGAGAHRLADRPNVTAVTLGEAFAEGGEEQVPTARAAERDRIAASAHRGG